VQRRLEAGTFVAPKPPAAAAPATPATPAAPAGAR
jgi:hypothetical protein